MMRSDAVQNFLPSLWLLSRSGSESIPLYFKLKNTGTVCKMQTFQGDLFFCSHKCLVFAAAVFKICSNYFFCQNIIELTKLQAQDFPFLSPTSENT